MHIAAALFLWWQPGWSQEAMISVCGPWVVRAASIVQVFTFASRNTARSGAACCKIQDRHGDVMGGCVSHVSRVTCHDTVMLHHQAVQIWSTSVLFFVVTGPLSSKQMGFLCRQDLDGRFYTVYLTHLLNLSENWVEIQQSVLVWNSLKPSFHHSVCFIALAASLKSVQSL